MEIGRSESSFALSEREVEVLLLASNGVTDKEIAQELNISKGTIRTYWERLRTKMGAKSRSEAIAKWFNAQREAKEGELELLRSMLNSLVSHALVALDKEGRFVSWNPGVLKLFGYEADEFIGKDLSLLIVGNESAKAQAVSELLEAAEEGPVIQDYDHVHKSGELIRYEGVLFGIWKDGEIKGYGKIVAVPNEMELHKQVSRATAGISETLESTERR